MTRNGVVFPVFRELAELLPQTILEADMQGRLMYASRVGFDTMEMVGESQDIKE